MKDLGLPINDYVGYRRNDTITAGSGDDLVLGLEGNDQLNGGSGNDTVDGGSGNDKLIGGTGDDILRGGSGTDKASYNGAAAGVEVNLAVTEAQNTIGAGTDTLTRIENLTGSDFDDILTGSGAENMLEGGPGNDTLDGGGRNDTASYRGSAEAVTVDLSLATAQDTGGAGIDTLISIERLIGSFYDDTLTGSSSANTLDGAKG